MSLKPSNEAKLSTKQSQIENFDFVRFTFADIHGISRGKAIPRRHVGRFMKEGIDLYAGTFSGKRTSRGAGIVFRNVCMRDKFGPEQKGSK